MSNYTGLSYYGIRMTSESATDKCWKCDTLFPWTVFIVKQRVVCICICLSCTSIIDHTECDIYYSCGILTCTVLSLLHILEQLMFIRYYYYLPL